MPVLTDELCKTFPNLGQLDLRQVNLEEITPHALHECKNLSTVLFYQNQLVHIDVKTFEMNQELKTLVLQDNFIRYFDGRVLNSLKKLRHLSLPENYLTELDLENFPTITTLIKLDLFSNNLKDLDPLLLLQKFPNLKVIYIHNNLFPCDRLIDILTVLRIHRVEIKAFQKERAIRNKNLPTIDNVECVGMVLMQNNDIPNVASAPIDELEETEKKLKKILQYIAIGVLCVIIICWCLYSMASKNTIVCCCCCDID